MLDLFRPDLGYFPVLTEFAVNVASGGRDGECLAFRKKMKKGFLFNRIYVGGAGFAVNKSIIDAIPVFPDSAISAFSVTQPAKPGA